MASLALLRRISSLDWRNRLVLGEALVVLAVASAAAAILPFRRAIQFGAGMPTVASDADAAAIRRIAWGVGRVAALMPWRAVCLHQGLALQWMLRRRGVDAVLRYGVGKGLDGELAAHVWVTVGPTIVIGGEAAADYREVASWPAS